MRYVYLILQRELLLAYRQRSDVFNPALFFVMTVSLFPLALGADPQQLARIAPGIIWVAILLALLLSLEKLFRRDVDDGVIEQWLLAPVSFSGLIFVKLFAQWLVTFIPLLLLAPLLADWLQLPWSAQKILLLSLCLGTPVLYFIGAIFSALTVQLRHGGLLLALLALPFYIPVLIFAASAVANAAAGLPVGGQLAFLGALLALALPLAPVVTAAALKVGMS